MSRVSSWVCVSALLAVCGCGASVAPAPLDETKGAKVDYPATRTDDVVDVLHGVEVPDPYRWLEDDESAEVKEWQAAQSALARAHLDAIPGREKVRDRIAELYRVDVEEPPVKKGDFYFQIRRKADEDQPSLYVSKSYDDPGEVLVSPATEADGDNTGAMDWWYPSGDGSLLAYGISLSGSERSVLKVVDVRTKERLADTIPNTRSSTVAWLPDNKGFYYSRRPDPEDKDETWFNRVFFHALGGDWKNDPLVFGGDSKNEDIHEPAVSPDGRRLVVTVHKGAGGAETELHYKNLEKPGAEFEYITAGEKAAFWADVTNDELLVLTNLDAPRYRVMAIDYDNSASSAWKEIIPQGEDPIDQILVLKDKIVVKSMHHAVVKLFVHDPSGARIAEVPLPTLGRAYGLSGGFEDEAFFYGFTSFAHAGDIYRMETADGAQPKLLSRISANVDPEKYEVKQVFFESKDGTKVPMFIVRSAGAKEGPTAALMYGYGGFNIALTPYFLARYMPFIEAGGVFAMPNLRGGSEYGESWHRDGMLDKKQHTFDDFIAAGEYIVSEKITTPDRLAILGGSNGGLLVGAAMVQRPDLIQGGGLAWCPCWT